MLFSWHVDLGSILNAVSLLIVAFVGAKKLGALELKMSLLWNWFRKEHDIAP